MDQITWIFMIFSELIIPIVGWASLFGLPFLLPYIYFRVFPKTARTFIAAKRKNMIPALIVHDSGRALITLIREKIGGGICETEKGKYKILPKFVEAEEITAEDEARAFPEEDKDKNDSEDASENTDQNTAKKPSLKRIVGALGDWVTKRCFLVGLGKPMFVGYSGKACLLNPLALALWEAGKLKIRNEAHKFIRKKVKGEDGKIPKIEDLLEPLMLLDPRSAKAVITHAFDEAQIAAMCATSEDIGRIGKGLPKWVLPVGIILIVVVAAGLILLLLTGAIPLPKM